jgi:hypothetical protein
MTQQKDQKAAGNHVRQMWEGPAGPPSFDWQKDHCRRDFLAGLAHARKEAEEEIARLKEMNQHRIGQGVELHAAREENTRLKAQLADAEKALEDLMEPTGLPLRASHQ